MMLSPDLETQQKLIFIPCWDCFFATNYTNFLEFNMCSLCLFFLPQIKNDSFIFCVCSFLPRIARIISNLICDLFFLADFADSADFL